MEVKKSFNAIVPYLVALVTFLSVCFICFAPVIEGRKLPTHDEMQYEGMRQDILEHKQKYGEDPQWEGRMFGGMPSYLISVDYGSTIIKTASRVIEKMAHPLGLIFIAMAGFFVMVLLCGVNPWVGIIPSLAYGLSTYLFLIIGAGHVTKMVALAYAPMMLGAVFYTFRKDMWMGAALTALFVSVEIAASHPQITYYFGFVLLAFWINELCIAIKERWIPRFAKITGLLLTAGVLGIGSNFITLYDVQSYSKYSMRGGSELKAAEGQAEGSNEKGLSLEYATAWSYGVGESFNMFIPYFKGGASGAIFSSDGPVAQTLVKYSMPVEYLPAYGGSPYWGDQPGTGGPTYLGAVMVFLAVLGMFLVKGRYKWWVIAVSAVAVMLAWGSNFMWFTKLFFTLFPGYDKFRTVSMILVVVQWSVPFLALAALWNLWQDRSDVKKIKKAILNSLYITGGLALFFALFGGIIFDFDALQDVNLPGDIANAMRMERTSMLRADSWRSLLMVALAAVMLWGYVAGWLKRKYAFAMMAVLVCVDLIPVDLRFLPHNKFQMPREMAVKPTQADLQILQDTTPGYRVANFAVSTFSDATTSYFHRSVGGYHGAKLQRYQDVIEQHLAKSNMQVYNMLNTKYFITADKSGALAVQQNPDANGAAWFVSDVELTSTPDEEIAALGHIDTKTTAVVDRGFDQVKEVLSAAPVDSGARLELTGAADSTVCIELTDYRVNRLTYKYRSDVPQMAVFSEIYYKDGWKATVDGKPLDYFRADYILRAAVLPAGEHTVVFSFAIPHFKTLSAITLLCSLLIILGIAAAYIVPKYFCKKKND